jgi:hypothetical protein
MKNKYPLMHLNNNLGNTSEISYIQDFPDLVYINAAFHREGIISKERYELYSIYAYETKLELSLMPEIFNVIYKDC